MPAARIVELKTRPKRVRIEQAERVCQALLPFEEELPELVAELRYRVDRLTQSKGRWTFVMLSPEQNAAVVQWLAKHSSRRIEAVQVWAHCFKHLDNETGEIRQSRGQIAESLGISADDISRIMTELEKVGAISRKRDRTAGRRGPGLVRYFMNPRVATHLDGTVRDAAQAVAPLLTLIEAKVPHRGK